MPVGRREGETRIVDGGAVFESADLSLELSCPLPLTSDGPGAQTTIELVEGQSVVLVLRQSTDATNSRRKPSITSTDIAAPALCAPATAHTIRCSSTFTAS
jgi:hypothetical protein